MSMLIEFFKHTFSTGYRFLFWIIGALWGLLQPTIPFAGIVAFAIVLDCITAWRLSKRVKKQNPKAKEDDGKFKSQYSRRMFYTLLIVWACTFLGWLIDDFMYPFVDLYLANFISSGFCLVQLISILENESSCNDARWAKVLQKVLVNKAARHLEIDPEDLQPSDTEPEIQPKQTPHQETTESGKKLLEETCGSETCAIRGKGICDFVEGMFCPMYNQKEEQHGKD